MLAFFRLIAIALIVLALVLLGGDVVSSLEKGDVVMRSLTDTLTLVGAHSTQWLEQTFPSYVASAVEMILSWPGWAVVGVLGLAVGALTLSPRYDDNDD